MLYKCNSNYVTTTNFHVFRKNKQCVVLKIHPRMALLPAHLYSLSPIKYITK